QSWLDTSGGMGGLPALAGTGADELPLPPVNPELTEHQPKSGSCFSAGPKRDGGNGAPDKRYRARRGLSGRHAATLWGRAILCGRHGPGGGHL
ncbi:MAG: hypothetical protein ACYSWU_16080, partial [Planctomycetota bacterium]